MSNNSFSKVKGILIKDVHFFLTNLCILKEVLNKQITKPFNWIFMHNEINDKYMSVCSFLTHILSYKF